MSTPSWIELDALFRRSASTMSPQAFAALTRHTVICDEDAACVGSACWYATPMDARAAASAYSADGGTPSWTYPADLGSLGSTPLDGADLVRQLDSALVQVGYRLDIGAIPELWRWEDVHERFIDLDTGREVSTDDHLWQHLQPLVSLIVVSRRHYIAPPGSAGFGGDPLVSRAQSPHWTLPSSESPAPAPRFASPGD